MTEYFDTHAHYDDRRYDADRHELLESLPGRGVTLALVPGCDLSSSRAAAALAERYAHVYAAAGTHPHEASSYTEGAARELRGLYALPKVVAVGEIGLDYHYDHSPRDVQRACFGSQLALAEELGLPVIVHDREAHGDALDILKNYNVRAVFHCYSGSLDMAKTIVNMGHCISFTGSVTFSNARRALETAAWLPTGRFMLETDAPYLTPAPHRGKRNHSAYLPHVAEAIAAARNTTVGQVAAQSYQNGLTFFGIKGP